MPICTANMLIDFPSLPMYNLAKEGKLIYFTTYFTSCQEERIYKMEDDETAMKILIESALSECNDMELLDLIYKLLIASNE